MFDFQIYFPLYFLYKIICTKTHTHKNFGQLTWFHKKSIMSKSLKLQKKNSKNPTIGKNDSLNDLAQAHIKIFETRNRLFLNFYINARKISTFLLQTTAKFDFFIFLS